MTPERWKQINDLFHAALDQAGDRQAFPQRAAPNDAELRSEVESLLRAHTSSDGFLETPAWGIAPELLVDEDEPVPGQLLGSYRVIEEIGRGGMGVVYAAEDTRLGRQVALKAVARGESRDAHHRERLRREARAAATLVHPSIATVFALEEFEGQLYVVSELVKGRTLREELRDGPLAPAVLRRTLCDVAEGLAAAHAHGIVHRDLKPENIVRAPDGRAKILDFGLARTAASHTPATVSALTREGAAIGTPGYMPPEQMSGGPVDPRADVFAFGVLAAELATGEHPFGPDPAAMVRRMTSLLEGSTLSPSPSWGPPDIDRVIRRCLRADPQDRYASGSELLAALSHPDAAPRVSASAAWWWQFHQLSISIALAALPALAWPMRAWLPRPGGSWLFFATLVLATISITARLNLVFTARVHPAELLAQRSRVFPWVPVLDVLLATVMAGAAVALAGAHDEVAGFVISLSVVILLSAIVIEPATTRAAGLRPASDG